MTRLKRSILGLLLLAGLAGLAGVAQADSHGGKLMIHDPWARATPGRAPNGAAFLTIRNTGDGDRLVAAASAVAARTELHTTQMDGGVMKMRQVEAIEVPAGGMAELKPGSYHVMLMGLKQPLKEGEAFDLTLRFAGGAEITVSVPVRAIGAMGSGHGSMHGHGKKKE